MSTPWDILAGILEDEDTGANIYPTPVESVSPDAIVLRPDTPWFETGPGYQYDQERYAAVALVPTGAPRDTFARLHELVHAIMHAARSASWELDTVSAPIVDESTGTPMLASTVSLIYRNCEE